MNIILSKSNILAVVILFLFAISPVNALDVSWHKESKNYNVYLGVVPASMIEQAPSLIDGEKILHGDTSKPSINMQYLMITIYRKVDSQRVRNATVIAAVSSRKLLRRNNVEKPLEKMLTSNQLIYANYFTMLEKVKYKIKLKIYESNKEGKDEITFSYER